MLDRLCELGIVENLQGMLVGEASAFHVSSPSQRLPLQEPGQHPKMIKHQLCFLSLCSPCLCLPWEANPAVPGYLQALALAVPNMRL